MNESWVKDQNILNKLVINQKKKRKKKHRKSTAYIYAASLSTKLMIKLICSSNNTTNAMDIYTYTELMILKVKIHTDRRNSAYACFQYH